ncbi:MAG: glucose-1-phosphate adenylyltransferase, partial [Oscillospiraceae bacterium]
MKKKKELIAMILAGGQGSRLYSLTETIAKPAVPFGGKYRIIDFTISNCVNSGIDTIGVLTQYQPLILNEYIGNGQPWDLNRTNGGIFPLPPYQQNEKSDWYTGTANAIYQNINFVERYHPENVLILSGDHIYKMDYGKMLEHHIEKNADCTIAVINVPIEEASRFGIVLTDDSSQVTGFEEKPIQPKSTLASMGVYIFNWEKLKAYLKNDALDASSEKDFGKNIIPKMLLDKQHLSTYEFTGYWKDVGTIDSFWEANMDLLNPASKLDINNSHWKVYARNMGMPPHYIDDYAHITSSLITEGCHISGTVDFSVVFTGAIIEKGAVVRDSVIMPGVRICSGAVVEYSIISENSVIEENVVVGNRPECMQDKSDFGIAVVGSNVVVPKDMVILP